MIDIKVGHQGSKVMILMDGKLYEMPWEVAKEMGISLLSHAGSAEEFVQVNRIIEDGAILQRGGFPMGLTNNPKIQREIYKKAQWDTKLRKYMPAPGARSQEIFGAPTIFQPTTPAQMLAALSRRERAVMRLILQREE